MRSVTIALTEPVNPAAPPIIAQTARLDWRDQLVVAVGFAQTLTDRFTAYAGFNYARNPAPSETLTPLIAAIGEHYATCGLAYRIDEGWAASGALEYQFPKKVTYNKPGFPLGQNAKERTSYIALHVMLSRRW
jgi:long-chain fatty acid transport protein